MIINKISASLVSIIIFFKQNKELSKTSISTPFSPNPTVLSPGSSSPSLLSTPRKSKSTPEDTSTPKLSAPKTENASSSQFLKLLCFCKLIEAHLRLKNTCNTGAIAFRRGTRSCLLEKETQSMKWIRSARRFRLATGKP